MKKFIKTYIVSLLVGLLLSNSLLAQENQKLAQSGFQFLSVVSDARGAAMAEALTSLQVGSSALFFNPAGMSDMKNFIDISASVNQWIADINHYTIAAAIRPFEGHFGVLGFSVQSVNYGEFFGTRVNPATELGYDDTGIFELSALAVGVGYAKQISDKFSIGGQVRYVQQDLGESIVPVISDVDTTSKSANNELSPLVFDFGTQFRTGIKSIVFGMSVRNFSKEVQYVEEGIQAPLVFTLGISMNVMDLFGEVPFDQALYLSLDASHHRDHPEEVKIGLDYKLMEILSLRGGYASSNDENDFSFGLGVSKYGFAFDYSYTPFGVFDKVQRMTVRFSL